MGKKLSEAKWYVVIVIIWVLVVIHETIWGKDEEEDEELGASY